MDANVQTLVQEPTQSPAQGDLQPHVPVDEQEPIAGFGRDAGSENEREVESPEHGVKQIDESAKTEEFTYEAATPEEDVLDEQARETLVGREEQRRRIEREESNPYRYGSRQPGQEHAPSQDDGRASHRNTHHNKDLGRRGEIAARRYLEHEGFDVLETNWRCKFGEADIVALDGSELVFVEVKTRTTEEVGLPEEAITPEKRARYERIAMAYLDTHTFGEVCVRFDVLAITMVNSSRAFLRHHRNAFSSEG